MSDLEELLTDDESIREPFSNNSSFRPSKGVLFGVVAFLAAFTLLAMYRSGQNLQHDHRLEGAILSVLNEQLRSSIEIQVRLAVTEQMKEISEHINDQTANRVNSVLEERLKAVSLQLDEALLNTAINKLIRESNLDNAKPDYASELNNAIILEASSTYTGKFESL